MSTPNKRRKKNDFQASPKPVRSLHDFFGKPKDGSKTNGAQAEIPQQDQQEESTLTDEQLARKLQAEWDAQDRPTQHGASDAEVTGIEPPVLAEEDLLGSRYQDNAHDELYAEPEEKADETTSTSIKDDSIKEEDNAPPAPAPANAFAFMGKKNTLSLQSATAEEDTISYNVPFDESPLTFDPQKYIPELRKQWTSTEDGNATYALLTRCFVLVNSTQSRIKIVDTLVNLLRVIIEGDPESLLPAVSIHA